MIARGRLLDTAAAPATGERLLPIAEFANVRIEQILSSADENPTVYVQEQTEWVVVLDGAATLDVDGTEVRLGSGDWVVLPAGVPHRVLATAPGTNWLAVHIHPREGRR
jgi:cupin 2 domain-containing protein